MTRSERYRDEVVERLRALVEERETSIHRIEKQLGRGRGYVADALRGDKKLSVELVVEVLEVLGVTPAQFFERPPPPASSRSEPLKSERRARGLTVETLPPSLRHASTLAQAILVVLANRGMVKLEEVEKVEREASG